MQFRKTLLSASLASLLIPVAANACDLCSVYFASEAHGDSSGWYAGFAEQFTHFGTLRFDGVRQPDESGQRLDSSITQLFVGHGFNDRLSAQLTMPFIVRSYSRPEGFETDSGTESGIGDISVVGRYLFMRRDTGKVTFTWKVDGGIKLPTGSANRIREEFHEEEVDGAPESGVHGHDLALGSGSTDAILGTALFLRSGRGFVEASMQHTARSKGSHDYRFADDTSWELAPGYYLSLEHEGTVALQLVLSGEHKGKDTFQGEEAEDTGITAVYVGPKLALTRGTRLSAELEVDFPAHIKNTALQLTADHRIRGGLTLRF